MRWRRIAVLAAAAVGVAAVSGGVVLVADRSGSSADPHVVVARYDVHAAVASLAIGHASRAQVTAMQSLLPDLVPFPDAVSARAFGSDAAQPATVLARLGHVAGFQADGSTDDPRHDERMLTFFSPASAVRSSIELTVAVAPSGPGSAIAVVAWAEPVPTKPATEDFPAVGSQATLTDLSDPRAHTLSPAQLTDLAALVAGAPAEPLGPNVGSCPRTTHSVLLTVRQERTTWRFRADIAGCSRYLAVSRDGRVLPALAAPTELVRILASIDGWPAPF